MSEANTAERAKPTPEERSLHRQLAKAMWKAQKNKDLPKDAAARKAMWEADKKAMIDQARRVARQMQRAGITMTAPAEEPAA